MQLTQTFWTLKPHLNVHGCLCIIYSRKISKQVTSQARLFIKFFPSNKVLDTCKMLMEHVIAIN